MGRPTRLDELQRLLLARAYHETEGTQIGLSKLFHIPKSVVGRDLLYVKNTYPEFCEFMDGLATSLRETHSKTELVAEAIKREEVRNEEQMSIKLQEMRKNLADSIEETIFHLLDLSPEELRSMKTDHKLRHIPELVKAMRLLREQSTENVQKLSLVKAISIATARRQAADSTDGTD